MRTPLAWLNSIEHPRRTAAAVGGVCFALLLIFMQAGFLGAARTNVSIIYTALDFDLVIHSSGYLTLPRCESFDRMRLKQASSVPHVASVTRFLIDGVTWRNPRTGSSASGYMLGVPPDHPAFLDQRTNAQLATLRPTLTALADRLGRGYGPWQVGDETQLNGQTTKITGDYALGLGLLADGSVILSEETFERLNGGAWMSNRANLGLIKITPGADPEAVARELRKHLPADVRVLSRSAIINREQNYFINVKPVGILFKVGMVVAFGAGAAILYQILSSEMNNRISEFATLKALGYPSSKIYLVGINQGLIYTLLAYGPALLLSISLYQVARRLSGFPVYMDIARAGFVLVLAFAMCVFAAVFSLWKIRRADPAALFR